MQARVPFPDHQAVLGAMILITLCMIPALGSLALLPMIAAAVIALPGIVAQRRWREQGARRWVWGALLAYWAYFTIGDALLQGDLAASLRAMAPNTPLLLAAIVAMALDPARAGLSAVRIGYAATGAVYAVFASAGVIWLVQPSWEILGRSVTDLTLVNGRLSMLVGNPLPFAASYMTLGFLALLGWHRRGRRSRVLGGGALALAVFTVALWSQSRGATLAALPLLVLAIWYIRPRPAHVIVVGLGLAVLGAIAIGLSGYGDRIIAVAARLIVGLSTATTGDVALESSTGQRVMMYRAGYLAWQESPIWGHGITRQFAAAIPYLVQDETFRYTHLHNAVVTHAVSGGVLGVGILLCVLCAPFAVNRINSRGRPAPAEVDKRDRRYFAAAIFLALFGVGMTSLILRHDVSANFLGALLLAHLAMQAGPASGPRAAR